MGVLGLGDFGLSGSAYASDQPAGKLMTTAAGLKKDAAFLRTQAASVGDPAQIQSFLSQASELERQAGLIETQAHQIAGRSGLEAAKKVEAVKAATVKPQAAIEVQGGSPRVVAPAYQSGSISQSVLMQQLLAERQGQQQQRALPSLIDLTGKSERQVKTALWVAGSVAALLTVGLMIKWAKG